MPSRAFDDSLALVRLDVLDDSLMPVLMPSRAFDDSLRPNSTILQDWLRKGLNALAGVR